MSDEKAQVAVPQVELPPDGIGADGKPTFIPSRYIRRETEVLAVRIETEEQAQEVGGKVGEWYVTDDRGVRKALSDDEFTHYYREYEGASWPGKIAMQLGNNLSAHGCKAVMFPTVGFAGQLNAWAERDENFGKLISVILPMGDMTLVLYTNTLSDRERAEVQEVQIEARAQIEKRHKEALENQAESLNLALKAEREAREAAEQKAKDDAELIELGRKHRANCKKAKA